MGKARPTRHLVGSRYRQAWMREHRASERNAGGPAGHQSFMAKLCGADGCVSTKVARAHRENRVAADAQANCRRHPDADGGRPARARVHGTTKAVPAVRFAAEQTAGFPLEFVPVNDRGHVHLGDTLHVKIVGSGKPVAGIGIDATPANDTIASAGAPATNLAVTRMADANGVVHIPLTRAGPWMLRSAFVSRKNGGVANEWDVSRTTYVFNVGAGH